MHEIMDYGHRETMSCWRGRHLETLNFKSFFLSVKQMELYIIYKQQLWGFVSNVACLWYMLIVVQTTSCGRNSDRICIFKVLTLFTNLHIFLQKQVAGLEICIAV